MLLVQNKVRFVILLLVFHSAVLLIGQDLSETEAAQLLSAYVQRSSVTGNEKPAGEFLANVCREKGLHVRVFTDNTDSYNFAASLYPLESGKPNIIMLNHIDVVPPMDAANWKHPPFSGSIINDTIWGRGTIDMKGIATMQLLSISSFCDRAREEDLPMNVTLLSVSGEEEFGETGSMIISNDFLDVLNPIVVLGEGGVGTKDVITSEPEKLVFFISNSDKRALWLKLSLKLEASGHGSVPPLEYANKMMISSLNSLLAVRPGIRFNTETIRMFQSFGALEGGLKGFVLKRPRLFKPIIVSQLRKDPLLLSTVTNTITLTRFEAQDNANNQIPQEIEVVLDCRLIPETSTEEFLDGIRENLNNEHIEISVIRETQKAAATVPDRYYDALESALLHTYPGAGVMGVLFPATTDNNYFRDKGVPVYGIVPVFLEEDLLETIHNVNERIPVQPLIQGTEVFTLFLENMFRQYEDSDQ